MSETWSSLLAGVVGALVGGAASLAGTVLVNKMQMATNARMRIYDELLPRLERAVDDFGKYPLSEAADDAAKHVDETFAALRRASAIAGRQERRGVQDLSGLWFDYQRAETAMGEAPVPPPPFDGIIPTPEEKTQADTWERLRRERDLSRFLLMRQLDLFTKALGEKLR